MKHVNESIIPFIFLVTMIYIVFFIALNSLLLEDGRPYLPHNIAEYFSNAEKKAATTTIDFTGNNFYVKNNSLKISGKQYVNWLDLKKGMSGEEVTQIIGSPASIKKGITEVWNYDIDSKNTGMILLHANKVINWNAPGLVKNFN